MEEPRLKRGTKHAPHHCRACRRPVKECNQDRCAEKKKRRFEAGAALGAASGAPASALGAPASGAPASGAPASGAPASGAPASGAPASALGAPASGASASGALASAAGAPASGAPASGAPASGAPASASGASGAPASGAPASGAPASGAPASASGAPASGAPASGAAEAAARRKEKQLLADKAWREMNRWSAEEHQLPRQHEERAGHPKNIPEAACSHLQLFLLFLGNFFKESTIPQSQERAEEQEEKQRRAHEQTSPNTDSHHPSITFSFSSLLCFLSISLIMGFSSQPAETNYWQRGDDVWGSGYIQ